MRHLGKKKGGIEWAKDDKEAKYLSLFQYLALNARLIPCRASDKYQKGIPYDYSCPSTKDCLSDHICKYCGLYFGSIKSKQNHSSSCRKKESTPSVNIEQPRKVRPQRVAARHQKELLCAMAFQELEWHAIEDVYFEVDETEIPEDAVQNGTPVIDKLEPIWTSD